MLGDHIRKMRKEQGLTLQQFAALTRLSPGYISQIERGQAAPSLTSLQTIAEALKIPPMLLLEDSVSNAVTYYLPKEKQPIVTVPESDTVRYQLCSNLPSSDFMPSSLILAFFIKPHSKDFERPISHDTEELIIVTKGEVTVMRVGESIHMKTGDTLLLQKNIPHTIINDTDDEVSGYSIMTPAIWSLKN